MDEQLKQDSKNGAVKTTVGVIFITHGFLGAETSNPIPSEEKLELK